MLLREMDRQPVLEGERLLLRPLCTDDWDALYAVASDPLVWEHHPAQDRWQENVFRDFFEDALANGGALAAIDKTGGQIVGSSRYQNHFPDEARVEIGWTFLARSHWGGIYNREIKRMMLSHAFRFVEWVDFMVGETNMRSRRAMEKIGGRFSDYSEMRKMAGVPVEHVHYVITREDFANGPLSV
jgi:RimJ/RimL family protein N-acetyltransferase